MFPSARYIVVDSAFAPGDDRYFLGAFNDLDIAESFVTRVLGGSTDYHIEDMDN